MWRKYFRALPAQISSSDFRRQLVSLRVRNWPDELQSFVTAYSQQALASGAYS